VREIIVIALAATGWAFSLSGAVGILRMPDVYGRIQCSSKTITMGALPALIALVVGEGPISSYGGRALLIAVLLLVVNPAASHALARAAYKTGVPMWRGAVTDEVSRAREEEINERNGAAGDDRVLGAGLSPPGPHARRRGARRAAAEPEWRGDGPVRDGHRGVGAVRGARRTRRRAL
jgi:multicomponent Na+:H+ antiporter subunit G